MSSTSSAAPLRLSTEAFGARLRHELGVMDWRAPIVVVVAPPGLEGDAERACAEAAAAFGLTQEQQLHWAVRRDAAGREQLRAYNRARDRLIADRRLICIRAGSAADVRFLREVAPDLTATIDLFAELEAEAGEQSSWDACARELRALMEDRHATLDFTGLLPASVEQRELPLEALYQPLVDLDAADSLFELPRITRGWLVLGHPGTGKTTFVRHLAWTYARGRGDPLQIGDKVPLLLSLADYGWVRERDRLRSLVEFLPIWLTEQQVEHGAALTEHLPDVLLLLDGLDELRSTDARRAVIREVEQLIDTGRLGAVVVTGRSFLVDELRRQDHGLRLVNTNPPDEDQIRAFVTNFVELRRGTGIHTSDLIARIEGDTDLRALARTPLVLAFMVILDELEGRLPDRRIEIYYRLAEMLVDRWTRVRSIGASGSRHERPTRADALRVLGPLAWWALEHGGGVVGEDELLAELERIEARRETPKEASRRAKALLELLRADTALLVPQAGRRWSFVHQSIGEYFAGVEAERDPRRWNELLAEPFRAEWREIVLFCAGQLGVIDGRVESLDQLVEAVLAKSRRAGRYDAKYASLLMGLLSESPGLSRRQIDELVARLLDFVFVTFYSSAARGQVQQEFVTLLKNARGSVKDSLAGALQVLFSSRPGSIRWDYVLARPKSRAPSLSNLSRFGVKIFARVVLGQLILSMANSWARDYGINLQPTLKRWAKEPGWPYRFAAWLVTSDPALRDHPYTEVAPLILE